MNTYAIDLSGASKGYDAANLAKLLKAVGYVFLFGKNVNLVPRFIGTLTTKTGANPVDVTMGNPKSVTDPGYAPIMTADLEFSLSNIPGFFDVPIAHFHNTIVAQTVVYDTTCQGVREFVDKPYPVKGYFAIVSDAKGDPSKDLDNYTTFDYFDSTTSLCQKIYIGMVNSSKTDFYTPLSGLDAVLIDPNATQMALQNDVRRVLSQTGGLRTSKL